MINQLFAAALHGIEPPWFVQAADFDTERRRPTIRVDFSPAVDLPIRRRRGSTRFTTRRKSDCGI